MKTPEEIKRGLLACTELVMPADVQHAVMVGALAYIQRIEAQNAELVRKMEQLKADKKKIMEIANILSDAVTRLERERDAAVSDVSLFSECCTCRYDPQKKGYIPNDCYDCIAYCNYEWRGVPEKEEEHEVDSD